MLHRFTHDVFMDVYDPTLEGESSSHFAQYNVEMTLSSYIDTYRKNVVINSEVVNIECTDLGGQDDSM